MERKPVGVKLDEETLKRLKALGERLDRTPHWLMKEAIRQYLEREETAYRERQLLLERWESYQQTGESVPHDEVIQWLESWGTDKEGPCPSDMN